MDGPGRGFLNYLGWGAVLPFEIIYLHDGRRFGLGVAGLEIGTVTGLAVVAAPVVGPVIDRVGARVTAAGAGLALAAGYGGLAFAHTPRQAFAAAAFAGAGNGGLVAAYGLNGFVGLFLANAVTYVLYVVILVAVVPREVRPPPVTGGYRVLLRDRPFVRLALTNIAVIAVGWGVFTWIVPPYARDQIGVSPRLIGLLLSANALAVVLAQLPVAKLAEGRRRAVASC